MYALIDGAAIETRDALHESLARQLFLPEHYGRNLDALFDCLTDIHAPCDVVLRHPEELFAHLGVYADILQDVFRDAAAENPNLHFTVEG